MSHSLRMAEALAKKKRIRAGHRASATRTVRQITEVLEGDTPDRDRLSLLRITLKEKLETIKTLDTEIVDLIEDEGGLADEIELTKWTAFWESFESAIHSNTELSDVEKFNYLNSLLECSA